MPVGDFSSIGALVDAHESAKDAVKRQVRGYWGA